MPLPFITDTVGDLLNNYVHFITKQMQTIADALWGAENENDNEPIPLPVNIQTRGFISQEAADLALDFQPLTDAGYYGWDYYYGRMNCLYSINISYINGSLTIGTPAYIGKYNADGHNWEYLPDGCEPIMLDIINSYVEAHASDYIFTKETYPDKDILPVYYTDWSGTHIRFYQDNSGTPVYNGFKTSFPKANNTLYTANEVNIHNYNFLTFANDAYSSVDFSPARGCAGSYLSQSQDSVFITNTDNQTFINDYITNNNADHNYTYNYITEHGDTITVYYGDNYVITKSDPDAEITYNEYQNILVNVTDKINDDNGYEIKVPTYRENKYGPPVDPDDDIEVEMPVNEAEFGAGLTHYYVCNKGAGVLDDISAAMSTWDINNTGKDLYKNLLSCRLTKIGGIPAENSTFVIYGEELLYNGSPITINKVTGNPTIDLGEYEILPKFNDFRDYAPYTKAEIYIPYCGWLALPSHVMSSEDKPKIISGTIITDIIAATCKAIIKCNDTVIGEAAGVTAIDIPFVGENVGMKMAGIANSMISYGKSAASGISGVLSGAKAGSAGAGAAAAGGLVGIAGSLAQVAMAENANFTEICGKTGDGCQIGGLGSVYIKIQRPKTGGFEEPDFVPEDYGHTTGFLCMKKRLISDCTGLIICANVDTSGISGATERERSEIKRLLETGIIVEHPEE